MASQSTIEAAIEQRVSSAKTAKYSLWTIGVTDDPDRRKGEHDKPKHWMHWSADSETAARNAEQHFLDKGMNGGGGGGGKAGYVYIF